MNAGTTIYAGKRSRVRSQLLFALWHGHERDFYRAPGAGAEQFDADFLADGCRGDSPLEVGWRRDGFAVKTDNHITGDNAGLMRWLSGHDFIHVHALWRLQPEGRGFGTVQGPNLHPEPSPRHTTCSV